MEITLRKANAIQQSINDALKESLVHNTVSINEFQDAEFEISKYLDLAKSLIEKKSKLLVALFEIRKSVGEANARSGIDAKLCEVAFLEKTIALYNDVATDKERMDPSILSGKLEKIRNRKDESRSIYGRDEEVLTGIFTKDDLKNFKKIVSDSKKIKQKIQDEILELNIKTNISLSSDTEALLKEEGII